MELPARGLLPVMIHTSYTVKLPSNKISRYLSKWERSIENLLEITLPVHWYIEFFTLNFFGMTFKFSGIEFYILL